MIAHCLGAVVLTLSVTKLAIEYGSQDLVKLTLKATGSLFVFFNLKVSATSVVKGPSRQSVCKLFNNSNRCAHVESQAPEGQAGPTWWRLYSMLRTVCTGQGGLMGAMQAEAEFVNYYGSAQVVVRKDESL